MTVRLGQKASAFWGAPPPSCAQVSGSVPFGWCLGHGVYFSHSDIGAMAEIILVPLLMCFRLLGRSRPTQSVGRAWCRRTAVCPLDGHRIEKEGDSVATSLYFCLSLLSDSNNPSPRLSGYHGTSYPSSRRVPGIVVQNQDDVGVPNTSNLRP